MLCLVFVVGLVLLTGIAGQRALASEQDQGVSAHAEQRKQFKDVRVQVEPEIQAAQKLEKQREKEGYKPTVLATNPSHDPNFIVFGYQPSYRDGLEYHYRWHALTHIGYCFVDFTATGALQTTSWDGRAAAFKAGGAAEANGVKVVMVLANDNFDEGILDTVMQNASLRATLVTNVVNKVASDSYCQGVSLDFEFTWGTATREGITAFCQSLYTQLHAMSPERELSMYVNPTYSSTRHDVANLAPSLDYMLLSCYPWAGGFSSTVGAISPADNFVGQGNNYLDAGLPVLLGLKGAGAHAVVCDGYGYHAATLYHHLNMGWTGMEDAWYALPTVDASPAYNSVQTCVYNIYTSGSGEVISGRATDMAGNPLPDVEVAATPSGQTTRYATTNGKGLFAFSNMPSSTYITLTAAKPPHTFANKAVTTGLSSDYGGTGNVWGITFVSTSTTPPTAYSQSTSAISGVTTAISLSAGDDGHPNPPGQIAYAIATMPLHGVLSDPSGGEITTTPYTLAGNGNIVNYRACSYYSGPDQFYFTADDGGTPPEGGVSDPALVAVDVNNIICTTYEPQTNSVAPWPLRTSYHDSRTQVLYLAGDIEGAKRITGLALDVYVRPDGQLDNWTIRMKHTTRSSFASSPHFETTGWTTVYVNDEGPPTVGWYEFDFQTPFEYDGESNLIIDLSYDNSSSGTEDGYCFASETYAQRVVFGIANSTHGDPTTWSDWSAPGIYVATAVPNIRLKSEAGGEPIIGDFVQNCSVDIFDLVAFSNAWLSRLGEPDWCGQCDISDPEDDLINELDFAPFANHWGQTAE